jgi:sec-independent protein translocase protein TatC
MQDNDKQPFMTHLEELRRRLVTCAIAIGVGFVICYFFSERLFQVLVMPLKANMPADDRLIFTNLPEMFFTYLKTAFLAGALLVSPVLFHQIWMFIAPGLYQNEKRFAIPFVVCSTILFVGGALFGYFVVFPFGFRFFLGFANDYIQALPSVKQYFSFAIKLLLAFGLVFELPVVMFFLARMGLVTSELLRRKRKYAILLTFVLASILTPPDVVTQLMMAGPLIILYEISIFIAQLAGKRRAAKQALKEGAEE